MNNLNDLTTPYDYSNREYGTVPPDTQREPFRWVSEIAYKNVHRIVARGYDTTELVESGYGVVDMLFVDFQARIPLVEEEQMLNYVMILSLDDGLSPPAVLSRTVAQSRTLLTQACGASILAFGHAYGAYSAFGKRLDTYLQRAGEQGKTTTEMAQVLVGKHLSEEGLGVSNLMLNDPAARRMFARAEQLGVAGKYIAFMKQIVEEAQKHGSEPVDLDMLGATGATMMDLGFSPEAAWAIAAVTRTFAAGAHAIEEIERGKYTQLGQTLTPKEDYDGPDDRPVPPPDKRDKVAKPARTRTVDAWKQASDEQKKIRGGGYNPSTKTDAGTTTGRFDDGE